MKLIGIYQIRNTVNNKIYIGQSINIVKRIWEHKNKLKCNKHNNRFLQRSWKKHGEKSFEFKTLIICQQKDLDFYEELLVKGYKSNNSKYGYNLRQIQNSNAEMRTAKNTYKAGDTYNRLTLIKPSSIFTTNRERKWFCKCICGSQILIPASRVRHGHTKSCGCLNKEKCIERIVRFVKVHGPWNKKVNDLHVSGGNPVTQSPIAAALGGGQGNQGGT